MRRTWLFVLLVGAPLSAAAQFFPVPPPLEPPDQIIFSHLLHVEEYETQCSDCHDGVEKSRSIETSVLPTHETCEECHEVDDEDECALCHTNGKSPSHKLASHVKEAVFDHLAHLAREGVECRTCHPAAWTSPRASDRLVPGMKECASCHEPEMTRLDCGKCHTSLATLARGPSQTAVHGPGFFGLHGAWAVGSTTLCAQCHEQTFCGDCHARTTATRPSVGFPARIDRTFIHRGDWIGRHALEATARPGRCSQCHGSSYCVDCHTEEKTASNGDYRRSPHPPGYLRRGEGTKFHGREARLGIQKCAACHDQGAASNCVQCHQEGGIGGNPHPPGWSRRGREKELHRATACIPCHGAL